MRRGTNRSVRWISWMLALAALALVAPAYAAAPAPDLPAVAGGAGGLAVADSAEPGSPLDVSLISQTTAKGVVENPCCSAVDPTAYFDSNDQKMWSVINAYLEGGITIKWSWRDMNNNEQGLVTYTTNGPGYWWVWSWMTLDGTTWAGLRGPVKVNVYWNDNFWFSQDARINPSKIDHLTCADVNNPAGSSKTNFVPTDPIVCGYQRFNAQGLTGSHPLTCRFIDPNGSVYASSSNSIPTGYSDWSWTCSTGIAGQSAANQRGRWRFETQVDNGEYVLQRDFYIDNRNPNTPGVPGSPSELFVGQSGLFTAGTIDPDGDTVRFEFDWGDGTTSGWTGYVNGGTQVSVGHSWSSPGTKSVRVRAMDGYNGVTGWSSAASITIISQLPSAPLGLNAVAGPVLGDIHLTWQVPANQGNGGLVVAGYRIYRGEVAGSETFLADVGAVLGYTDSGLPNGATRYYVVSARNSAGEGPVSSRASASVPNVPNAPTGFDAVQGPAPGRIDMSWNPSSVNVPGNPVTGYRIYRGATPDALQFLVQVGDVLAYADLDLPEDATYSYAVTGVNGAGEGQRSPPDTAKTARRPSEPVTPAAHTGRAPGEIVVEWGQPLDHGGLPVGNFAVYRGNSSGVHTLLTVVGNVTSFTDTGLPENTTFHYRIAARNAVGEGGKTGEVRALSPARPSPPQLVYADRGPWIGQIDVHWSHPHSHGGIPLTGYKLYVSTEAGGDAVQVVGLGNVTSWLKTGLAEAERRCFKAAAINPVGEGPTASELCQRAPARPSEPRDLAAAPGAGAATVRLTWTPPLTNNGINVTNYTLYRSTGPGGVEVAVSLDANLTSFVDGHLVPGLRYDYRLTATNPVGEGPRSSAGTARASLLPPDQPTGAGQLGDADGDFVSDGVEALLCGPALVRDLLDGVADQFGSHFLGRCFGTTDYDLQHGVDPDHDYVPDGAVEEAVCRVENPNFTFDGSCSGSEYAPPPQTVEELLGGT